MRSDVVVKLGFLLSFIFSFSSYGENHSLPLLLLPQVVPGVIRGEALESKDFVKSTGEGVPKSSRTQNYGARNRRISFSSSALRLARTLIWRTTVPVIDGDSCSGKL